MERRSNSIESNLDEILSSFDVVEDSQSLVNELKDIRVKITASSLSRKSCSNIVDKLKDVNFGSTLKNVSRIPAEVEEYTPLITMESVRVALRRLDFCEKALSGQPTDLGSAALPNQNGTVSNYRGNVSLEPRNQRGRVSRTQLRNQRKGKCWICNGDNLAYQNPECKEALMKRRGSSNGRNPKEVNEDKSEVRRTKQSVSRICWGDSEDTTRTGITMLTKSSLMGAVQSCDVIVDGGAN